MPSAIDPRAVTPTNFQDHPHSAWGFHHVRELHRTSRVWRGQGPVWGLPGQPGDLGGLELEAPGGNHSNLRDVLDVARLDGFIVLHKGAIAHEFYNNGMRARDPHILMSTTKSFAGSLAGILMALGKLDDSAVVTDLLPSLAGTAYDGATVRHLLDMRVGLDFSEDYRDPDCDFAYMDAAMGWRPRREAGAPDNLADFMTTMRKGPPHGGSFHYVSPNAVVLGWVLEAVTGERFADLLSQLIWRPMGAEFDADLVLDSNGASQTEGGLNVTLRDLARFGELHRLGGKVNGEQIVPADFIADFRENGDAQAWDAGTMAAMMPGFHYRSQWYTNRVHDHHPFMTLGAFGQSVYVDLVSEIVVAQMSCFPGDEEDTGFDAMFRCFYAISDHYKPK
jgi:CubicO group peptidase (beta-lactamase class C family)